MSRHQAELQKSRLASCLVAEEEETSQPERGKAGTRGRGTDIERMES